MSRPAKRVGAQISARMALRTRSSFIRFTSVRPAGSSPAAPIFFCPGLVTGVFLCLVQVLSLGSRDSATSRIDKLPDIAQRIRPFSGTF